jgi:hypothetical protein
MMDFPLSTVRKVTLYWKRLACWMFGHEWILMPYEDGPQSPWSYENHKCARCGARLRQLVASQIG